MASRTINDALPLIGELEDRVIALDTIVRRQEKALLMLVAYLKRRPFSESLIKQELNAVRDVVSGKSND